jgi:hypothetical protein
MNQSTLQDRYLERRRARRAAIKGALLPILQECEARGQRPDYGALALHFDCGKSTLRQMAHEYGEADLIVPPEARRIADLCERGILDLADRIRVVREAKLERCRECGKLSLSEEVLERILP